MPILLDILLLSIINLVQVVVDFYTQDNAKIALLELNQSPLSHLSKTIKMNVMALIEIEPVAPKSHVDSAITVSVE